MRKQQHRVKAKVLECSSSLCKCKTRREVDVAASPRYIRVKLENIIETMRLLQTAVL